MYKLILSLVCISFVFTGCTKAKIEEKNILGDWEAIKGDYQEVSFYKEDGKSKFSAYLNGRLFTDGAWLIKGDSLILQLSTGETVTYTRVAVKNGILELNGGQQQYQPLRTDQQKIDELIAAVASIEGISFSKPADTQFPWNFDEGTSEKKVKGKMIKATIQLTTDDYTDLANASRKVVELLTSKGFTSSDYNMTEIQSAAENGPLKVLIKQQAPISYDPETDTPVSIKGQNAYLEIMCGVIE